MNVLLILVWVEAQEFKLSCKSEKHEETVFFTIYTCICIYIYIYIYVYLYICAYIF